MPEASHQDGEEDTGKTGTLEGPEEPPWKSPGTTPETKWDKGHFHGGPVRRVGHGASCGQSAGGGMEDLQGETKGSVDRAEGRQRKGFRLLSIGHQGGINSSCMGKKDKVQTEA